jgi:hypothetical protein
MTSKDENLERILDNRVIAIATRCARLTSSAQGRQRRG